MLKKNIVLFDMDGTLTPAREAASIPIAVALNELSRYSTIGIVTGSQYEYLQQQCGTILNSLIGPDLSRVMLFPCNGGQFYKWYGATWQLLSDKNMQSHLGDEKFTELLKTCVYILNATLEDKAHEAWDLSGNFIEYRGPMINLCFPGRQASREARKKFESVDAATGVRNQALQRLIGKMQLEQIEGLECKLGGNTSIDIFPSGWNKTLVLEHLEDFTVWFVGDRCEGNGNDREIYEHTAQGRRGFQTTGPGHTIKIIDDIIDIIRGNK